MNFVKFLARRFGWWLQGYPAEVHTRRIHVREMPGWLPIYRLGICIYWWGLQ